MQNKEVALRKRQQIDSSKRIMFGVVAIVGFVAGVSLVVSYFLIMQIIYQGKILTIKSDTIDTIKSNIKTVDDLKDNLRVLETNEALKQAKSKEDSSALQVILDALPSEPNADALGSSLQDKIVGGVSGLKLTNLSISDPTALLSIPSQVVVGGAQSTPSIEFGMTVSGSPDSLKALLARMEKSIRVFDIKALEVSASGGGLEMKISGKAYYDPTYVVKLETITFKPDDEMPGGKKK